MHNKLYVTGVLALAISVPLTSQSASAKYKTQRTIKTVNTKKVVAKPAASKPNSVKLSVAQPAGPLPGTVAPDLKHPEFAKTTKRGMWHSTDLIQPYKGVLYTVENGSLFGTTPKGQYRKLGVADDYKLAVDMEAAYNQLFVIDSDRTLYSVLPDGTRKQVTDKGTFNIRHMATLDDELFGIEEDGTLYTISPLGAVKQVGPAGGWLKVTSLFAFRGQLWAMDRGTLYAADREVKWKQVGGVGTWKWYKFLVPGHNKLWTVANGKLFAIDVNGKRALIDANRWKNVDTMAVMNGKLYSIENTGQMFVIPVK